MNARVRMLLAVLAVPALLQHASGQSISIKGSNTFGEELGQRLIAGYRLKQPQVDIGLEREGSGSGLLALLDGTCDIASSSRLINEDEQRLAKSRGIRVRHYVIGYYGIAVIVHADNPLKNLSDRQVRHLFTGATGNWKDLGGADQPVTVCIRDPVAGTHLGFRELAMENRAYSPQARAFASYEDIQHAVAADPGAIGYVSMRMTEHPGIHPVSINGLPAVDIAINEGLYPYIRTLRLYTDRARETTTVRSFIRFVQSKDGQAIVDQTGFIPVRRPQLLPLSPEM